METDPLATLPHVRPVTLEDAVAALKTDLEDVEAAHDEVTDTQVREELSAALERLFVRPEPGYVLPPTFFMYTTAGNGAVRDALEAFAGRCADAYPQEGCPAARRALLADLAEFVGVPSTRPGRG